MPNCIERCETLRRSLVALDEREDAAYAAAAEVRDAMKHNRLGGIAPWERVGVVEQNSQSILRETMGSRRTLEERAMHCAGNIGMAQTSDVSPETPEACAVAV